MNVKKCIYITAFIIFGILLQQIVHAGLEMVVIKLLLLDFQKYSLGLSWSTWVMIHHGVTIVLFLGGIFFGWVQGHYWWRVLYVERRWFKKGH